MPQITGTRITLGRSVHYRKGELLEGVTVARVKLTNWICITRRRRKETTGVFPGRTVLERQTGRHSVLESTGQGHRNSRGTASRTLLAVTGYDRRLTVSAIFICLLQTRANVTNDRTSTV